MIPGWKSDHCHRSLSIFSFALVHSSKCLTHSKEQSLSWEATRSSAGQEIPRILWNPKFRYRIDKIPPRVPTLSQTIQSIPPHSTSRKSLLILSYHLRLGLPNGLFHSGFSTNTLYEPLLSPIHALNRWNVINKLLVEGCVAVWCRNQRRILVQRQV